MAHLTWLEAATVGLVQGVSELFPVSGLGHSVLLPAVVGGRWASDVDVSSSESSARWAMESVFRYFSDPCSRVPAPMSPCDGSRAGSAATRYALSGSLASWRGLPA